MVIACGSWYNKKFSRCLCIDSVIYFIDKMKCTNKMYGQRWITHRGSYSTTMRMPSFVFLSIISPWWITQGTLFTGLFVKRCFIVGCSFSIWNVHPCIPLLELQIRMLTFTTNWKTKLRMPYILGFVVSFVDGFEIYHYDLSSAESNLLGQCVK